MICNVPEHGKTQPNHPDPVGPPLDYMAKCKVFDCIQLDLYDPCCFYALGTTGNPPDFPTLQEPVMHSQVGFDKKSAAGSDSKPSSGDGGDSSQGGGSTRATPKKKDSNAPATDSQGSSAPMASQMTPCCSRCDKSHRSKPHKNSKSKKDSLGDKKKKKGHASPARKGSGHKSHKHSGRR